MRGDKGERGLEGPRGNLGMTGSMGPPGEDGVIHFISSKAKFLQASFQPAGLRGLPGPTVSFTETFEPSNGFFVSRVTLVFLEILDLKDLMVY